MSAASRDPSPREGMRPPGRTARGSRRKRISPVDVYFLAGSPRDADGPRIAGSSTSSVASHGFSRGAWQATQPSP